MFVYVYMGQDKYGREKMVVVVATGTGVTVISGYSEVGYLDFYNKTLRAVGLSEFVVRKLVVPVPAGGDELQAVVVRTWCGSVLN